MIDGIQLKLCGITSLVDAEAADALGFDYLGFNFYPPSPRYVPLRQYQAMGARLPERKRIAVVVEPSLDDLRALKEAGFKKFQIHFRPEVPAAQVAGWSGLVEPANLWLAPKLPPGTELNLDLLPLAGTFLLDGYRADKFGGTGRPTDWAAYRRLRESRPDHAWVLSGGLSPANIAEALNATGARFVDVNSGVESAPGVKDSAKIKAFVSQLRR